MHVSHAPLAVSASFRAGFWWRGFLRSRSLNLLLHRLGLGGVHDCPVFRFANISFMVLPPLSVDERCFFSDEFVKDWVGLFLMLHFFRFGAAFLHFLPARV